MSWRKVGSNIVVVAHQFNPSIISQLWLVRNGVVDEDAFLPDCLFTPMAAQVWTKQFNLLIMPNQLQFTPDVSEQEEQGLILEKVGRIVETLPHTPFRAIGLNFIWHLAPGNTGIAQLTRDLFFRDDRPLFRHFDFEDAHFGAYLSKNTLGFRLKLDAKPIQVEKEEGNENVVQFSFNFHSSISDDEPVHCLKELLVRWNQARQEANTLIAAVEPRGES